MRILKNTDLVMRERRGSIAVESAILLPLFIIGILTIGYLLKFCMVSEGVHHALTDEAHRIMAEASIVPFPIGAEGELAQRIKNEGRGDVRDVSAERFLYRVQGISKSGKSYSELIAISVSFDTPLKLPRLFRSQVGGERTTLCRAFVGKAEAGPAMPLSEMEQGDDEKTVWVFPRAGERYHAESCSYIQNNPREILLDRSVRGRYNPCKLCEPSGCRDGSLVYCFDISGRAYHTGACTVVERYVIEISKSDAERQGYRSCVKCGGG